MNGREVRVSAEFARYDSMEECFADRDRLIATVPCYAGARACGGDPEAFARALAVHWATDPHYADKLLARLPRQPARRARLRITRSPDHRDHPIPLHPILQCKEQL